MKSKTKIAVTSRAFSKNATLRSELAERYENIAFNDTGKTLNRSELVNFLKGSEKAIVSLEPIDDGILEQLPELRVISKYGVGLDNIRLEDLQKRGISLAWKGGVNRRSVSELTLSFMITCLRDVFRSNNQMRMGQWNQYPGTQLSGKTVGIIGCGHIGKDLVKLLQPFECKILVYDSKSYSEFYLQYQIEEVSLEDSHLLQLRSSIYV